MILRKKRSEKKEKAVKFLLQPRPQKDPLAADIDAPINVLIPQDPDADIENIRQKLSDLDPKVFVSKEETKVGMLERAHNADGIQFDMDILNAMSKEFDYNDPNNILDDDFMNQAGGLIEDDGGELIEEELGEMFDDEGEHVELFEFKSKNPENLSHGLKQMQTKYTTGQYEDDDDDLDDFQDARSETKSVFTNYSMTSSVMRRSQGLQQIDEHFERLYEKEYANDAEVGALEFDEVKGEKHLSDINQIRLLKDEVKIVRRRNHGDDYEPEIVSNHHKTAIIGDSDEDEQDLVDTEIIRRENKIDCESILSYNSNLYNHPKLILEPRRRLSSRTQDDQSQDDRSRSGRGTSIASSRATVLSKLSIRPAGEKPEERRLRKQALKNYRRERRQERKQNQMIFKMERANVVKQQKSNPPAIRLI